MDNKVFELKKLPIKKKNFIHFFLDWLCIGLFLASSVYYGFETRWTECILFGVGGALFVLLYLRESILDKIAQNVNDCVDIVNEAYRNL